MSKDSDSALSWPALKPSQGYFLTLDCQAQLAVPRNRPVTEQGLPAPMDLTGAQIMLLWEKPTIVLTPMLRGPPEAADTVMCPQSFTLPLIIVLPLKNVGPKQVPEGSTRSNVV